MQDKYAVALSTRRAAAFFDQTPQWMNWVRKTVNPKSPYTGEEIFPKGEVGKPYTYTVGMLLLLADALLYGQLISRLEHEAVCRRLYMIEGT